MLVAVSSVKASCNAATVSLVMAQALKRQLLADAMEAAAAGEDVVGAQAHCLAAREQGLDGMDGGLVIGGAVKRHDDNGIADVEIHVAGGDKLAIADDFAGRWQ